MYLAPQKRSYMEKFYVSLDDFGQITPSDKERKILLGISILFGIGFVFMLVIGFSQNDIYLLFSLVNALLLLSVALGAIFLYRGKNIFQLPLGTFFHVGEERISYKFSIFAAPKIYRWEEIQKAEMNMTVVHLWIKNEIHEIDLQDIQSSAQQRLVKQKVREALQFKGLLKNAA